MISGLLTHYYEGLNDSSCQGWDAERTVLERECVDKIQGT